MAGRGFEEGGKGGEEAGEEREGELKYENAEQLRYISCSGTMDSKLRRTKRGAYLMPEYFPPDISSMFSTLPFLSSYPAFLFFHIREGIAT